MVPSRLVIIPERAFSVVTPNVFRLISLNVEIPDVAFTLPFRVPVNVVPITLPVRSPWKLVAVSVPDTFASVASNRATVPIPLVT